MLANFTHHNYTLTTNEPHILTKSRSIYVLKVCDNFVLIVVFQVLTKHEVAITRSSDNESYVKGSKVWTDYIVPRG